MHAKQNTLQSVVEQRIARANTSRPQKLDLSKLKPNEDEVDLFRIPDRKDQSGWRGPCDLLHLGKDTAIVRHQGVPYIVPIRHIRPHIQLLAQLVPIYFGSDVLLKGIAKLNRQRSTTIDGVIPAANATKQSAVDILLNGVNAVTKLD